MSNGASQRGGQANGNSLDEVLRGATRPAAVVAIVLCVGFAVAMVAIWSFRKPGSHQEMQTQPKAAVQTEIQQPEAVQAEIEEPEPVSRVWEPNRAVALQPSTATPVSQANPAAPQSMDGHISSPTPVQADQSHTFSHDLNAETTTFEGVNPRTKVAGLMTVTITGTFSGEQLWDGQSPVGSRLQANQQAAFSFVSYDRLAPSYSATVKLMPTGGDTTDDSITFNFGVNAKGSDGSSQRFNLREVITVTEDDAQIALEQILP